MDDELRELDRQRRREFERQAASDAEFREYCQSLTRDTPTGDSGGLMQTGVSLDGNIQGSDELEQRPVQREVSEGGAAVGTTGLATPPTGRATGCETRLRCSSEEVDHD